MSAFKPGDFVESLHPKLDLGGAVTVTAVEKSGLLRLYGVSMLIEPRDVREACEPVGACKDGQSCKEHPYGRKDQCRAMDLGAVTIRQCGLLAGHKSECEFVRGRPQNMSDFKVGDVVRFKNARVPGKVESIPGPSRVNVHVAGITYYNMDPADLTLVSRPSEAKPPPALKVGDRVRVIQRPGKDSFSSWVGTIGTIFEWHEPTKTWGIRHEAGKVHGREWSGWSADSLELLPPEPASLKYDIVLACDCNPLGQIGHPCVCRQRGADLAGRYRREHLGEFPPPPKPMTATEAGIKDRAFREQERYLASQLISRVAKKLFSNVAGVVPPAPKPDTQGWMPAGTYMPLKEEPKVKAKSIAAGMTPQQQLDYMMGCAPGDCLCMERGPGIVKTISHHERRFPSRTLSWTNLGDEYDLLPDAY